MPGFDLSQSARLPDDSHLGAYCLSLDSGDGFYYVSRSEFWMWGGELTRMNKTAVSGKLADRDVAKEFAAGYAAAHPGCMTDAQAVEAFVPKEKP